MRRSQPGKSSSDRAASPDILRAVPHRNRAMEVSPGPRGAMVSVPVRRPSWLVPPISWILPFSSHRRVELDDLGLEVLNLCNGRNTVESVIEKFAADHKLSFREAQLSVTQFLRLLTERGLVAVVGSGKSSGT
jgi:hypothetical protein